MLSDITTGNAPVDARDFSNWFIGDIKKWSEENRTSFAPELFRLRDNSDIEFRWGVCKKDEERSGGWAHCSNCTAISILIRGHIIFKFRNPENSHEFARYELKSEGDYIIWKEDIEHWWKTKEDSTILTVRWISA